MSRAAVRGGLWHGLWAIALLFSFAATTVFGATVPGQDASSTSPNKVIVAGIYPVPPFCVKMPNGEWSGLSVELWDILAKRLGIRYTFKEFTFEELLRSVANGDVSVGIGPVSLTPDREAIMDFTHPYYVSDLSIAVPKRPAFFPWSEVVAEFLTWAWFKLVLCLILMLSISGVLVWYFERQHNHNQFGGGVHHGLGSGFWWAAVTMSGVGYGDKAPVTVGGRFVALVWMFISVITVALVTGSITSAVVTTRTLYNIHSPRDLGRAHVAVLDGSTAEKYALETRIEYSIYPTVEACLKALSHKEVDACIGNETELRYLAKKQFPHQLEILPFSFQREDCSFVVPTDSPLQEKINRELLTEIQSDEWRHLREKYLGD